MNPDQIHLSDWKRILLGTTQASFLIEEFLRTLVLYIALLAVVRLLGKRMSAQLTITEMAVIITLGAIVSVPMEMGDRGLLQGVLLLVGALIFQQGVSWLGVKSPRFEQVSQGSASALVKDGVIQLEAMSKAGVSHDQLFASLRNQQIGNLGGVKRVYLEACGVISVFKTSKPAAGLSVMPDTDPSIAQVQRRAPGNRQVCRRCGFVVDSHARASTCPHCGAREWTDALAETSSL